MSLADLLVRVGEELWRALERRAERQRAAKAWAERPAPVRACPRCGEVAYTPGLSQCPKCGAPIDLPLR